MAVVKPDHLGDLILSRPAINALAVIYTDLVLFVGSGSLRLAQFLFPRIEVRAFDLPHLVKSAQAPGQRLAAPSALAGFDPVVFLRDDPPLRILAASLRAEQFWATGDGLTHETQIQRAGLAPLVTYFRSQAADLPHMVWPGAPEWVGLCIGAGFPTNRWPEWHWIQLASALRRKGSEVRILAGPAERASAEFVRRAVGLAPVAVTVGTDDYGAFLDAAKGCDVMVATDGGSAHLCAMVRPTLSLFGSSPWRRYAPFGRCHRVVSLCVDCSPCVQFSRSQLNACLSRECLTLLPPTLVLAGLRADDADSPLQLGAAKVWFGASHLVPGGDLRGLSD